MDVQVYDSGNPDRLLGTVSLRSVPQGCSFRLPVCRPLAVVNFYTNIVVPEISTVYFLISDKSVSESRKIDPVTEVITITRTTVLLTDVPLETLMDLDCFRLPGETSSQSASRRGYCWGRTLCLT